MSSTLVKTAPDARRPPHSSRARRNTAAVLAIILATYLMIVLDISVVIAALPKHPAARCDFSPTGLSWVQSAYTLTLRRPAAARRARR